MPIFHTHKEHIDATLDEQLVSTRDGGVQRFLVCWLGRPDSDDTWILVMISSGLIDLFEYYQSRSASHSTELSFLYPGEVGEDTDLGPKPTLAVSMGVGP